MKRILFFMLAMIVLLGRAAHATIIDFDTLPEGGPLAADSFLSHQYAYL